MTTTAEALKLTPRIVDATAAYYERRRQIDQERIQTLESLIVELRIQIEDLLEVKD